MKTLSLEILRYVLLATSLTHSFAAQSQTLSISSPASGAMVQPGHVLNVTVVATNPNLMSQEGIIGSGPLGTSTIQTPTARQNFTLQIPSNTPTGTVYVTAIGQLSSGGEVKSTPVVLTVPVSGSVLSLQPNFTNLVLSSPGDQVGLDVEAVTSKGSITLNPQTVSFVSGNPQVASVSAIGLVTGQGIGNTQIQVTYGSGSGAVSSIVKIEVQGGLRGDINGDGRVDIDDVKLLEMQLNIPASSPNDARDLNHDGVINALDARILVTLCTHPGCTY